MVARVVKVDKKATTFGDEEMELEGVAKKAKKVSEEYPKSFAKIMSLNGTARIMKCKDGCGEYDDIINIYIDEKGLFENKNPKVINAKGKQEVLPENVQRKDLTFWGGNPRAVTAEYRKKKTSRPIKRRKVSKRKL